MRKQKEQRIIDKPTPEQVKALLEKAKKGAKQPGQKKEKQAPDKFDLILKALDKYRAKVDKIEDILSQKDSTEQKTQTQEKPTSKEMLAEAEAEQEKAEKKKGQPGGSPGQPEQRQVSREEYEKLSDSEKIKLLEAQVQQQQGAKLSGRELLYGAVEVAKVFGPVAQTAIAKGGNSDNPLKEFLGQMQIYEKIQEGTIGRFFNYMKMLTSGRQKTILDNIAASSSGNVESARTDDGHIKK
ncbi:hypothetical protein ES702_07229 [subsurface metagenome]